MKATQTHIIHTLLAVLLMGAGCLSLFTSCSTTRALGEDEFLYTGIKSVNVEGKQGTRPEATALEEAEAALAYPPNNSFFGSSSIRTPLPVGLWVYNAMAGKEHKGMGKWILNTFGSVPKTIASVSPDTRVMVARNVLQNYGYFQAAVDYKLHTGKNPKKQKISYDIKLGHPYTFDSIRYAFPPMLDRIVRSTAENTHLHLGNQFSVVDLQSERNRLNTEFHNNGFYYYRPDYINYYADSVNNPGKVKLLVASEKTIPLQAQRPWKFGHLSTFIRQNKSGRTMAFDDTLTFRRLTIAYQGKRLPISPRVMFRSFKFRTGQIYSEENVSRTIASLASMNIFSNVQFGFTPHDTTDTCSILDVRLDATMDKLIDAEVAFNFTQKSNSQIGPDLSLTLSKRNAFHRGETLSLTLKGLYYWQTVGRVSGESNRTDTYEWGIEAGYTVPWIAFPGLVNRRRRYPVSTHFTAGFTRSNLANLYRYNRMLAGVDYNFQTSRYITHTFSPLNIDLLDIRDVSEDYLNAFEQHKSVLANILSEAYIPSMQYTFNYDNSSNRALNVTTHFSATVKESGNLISAALCLGGQDWDEKGKDFIFTDYDQYVKLNLELRNKFRLTPRSCIATRALFGAAYAYGNSEYVPSTDWFYSGGANSIRAFGARSIGPGAYHATQDDYYLYHSGDIRLELNAEYRFPLFGNLYGALFLDAGNVWGWKDSANDDNILGTYELRPSTFLNQIALGTGFGFRFDMEFLVLRFDIGLALHAPYDTGKSGYFNIPNLWNDGTALHFAVGYPF
ncbi:MAG: BamA/TamA family outer membrane protein [Bacteroidaceae bacterium]|nr:BamA/TamA family outer membrane protein [Bacteroidaceae bacterium]